MALFCVISANSGSFRAHCVKVHVRYLISWWVLVHTRQTDRQRSHSIRRIFTNGRPKIILLLFMIEFTVAAAAAAASNIVARGSARLADSTIYSYAPYAFKLSLISYRTFKKTTFSYSLHPWTSRRYTNYIIILIIIIMLTVRYEVGHWQCSGTRYPKSYTQLSSKGKCITRSPTLCSTDVLPHSRFVVLYLATITSSYSLSLWTSRQTHSDSVSCFSDIRQTYFSANSLRHVSENIQARLIIDFMKQSHFCI